MELYRKHGHWVSSIIPNKRNMNWLKRFLGFRKLIVSNKFLGISKCRKYEVFPLFMQETQCFLICLLWIFFPHVSFYCCFHYVWIYTSVWPINLSIPQERSYLQASSTLNLFIIRYNVMYVTFAGFRLNISPCGFLYQLKAK